MRPVLSWCERDTYPGAACDVPSSLYSYSFSPNHSWPRRYAAQPDILAYLRRTAAPVRDRIRFGAEVVSAAFDGERWRVELAGGGVVHADVLVSAVGQLNRPAVPSLPGLERFAGRCSTARAAARRGAAASGSVVGTGASAAQFVPRVQPAGHLTVFQRSAPHVLPKPDARLRDRRTRGRGRAARVWLACEAFTWLLTSGGSRAGWSRASRRRTGWSGCATGRCGNGCGHARRWAANGSCSATTGTRRSPRRTSTW
ncbi:hypothetical protein BBK82_30070 [Lentzea guizhouensis]|uniref:Uncharacterized protein n=1 Tax=Lentzea guizhouensis TaxID=1586287 RepID=A0A1B2HPL7_9PSEU|nr:NAD(P)/FAD-dependent oxidoreductase [Lentzea guizhouensis]ANZ39659.1 hypothetical protein BBK82_30070 [Lentzea guizhouensis]